jgi:hypothetical protein
VAFRRQVPVLGRYVVDLLVPELRKPFTKDV